MLVSFALLAVDQPSRSFIRPWFVALAYLILVGLSLWVWRRDGLRKTSGTWLWPGLMILFAVLGAGKLVDAQGALTDLLRQEAIHDEWYHFRGPVQAGIVAASALAAALGMFMVRRMAAGRESRRDLVILAPVLLLLGFYAIRATSWHNVDAVLFRFLAGTRINTWAELTIQGLIALALLEQGARRRAPASALSPREEAVVG